MPFMIRIFFQDQPEAVALGQFGTFKTMLAAPIDGADPDGAVVQSPAAPAPRTFGVGEEPLQPLAELRQGKSLVSPVTVSPPVNPKPIHEALHLGNRLEKFGVVQLTGVT
jgi:hypothetical protein